MLRSMFHVFARKKTGFLVKGPELNLAEDGLEASMAISRASHGKAFGESACHCLRICGGCICIIHAIPRFSLFPCRTACLSAARQYPSICNRHRRWQSGDFSLNLVGCVQYRRGNAWRYDKDGVASCPSIKPRRYRKRRVPFAGQFALAHD